MFSLILSIYDVMMNFKMTNWLDVILQFSKEEGKQTGERVYPCLPSHVSLQFAYKITLTGTDHSLKIRRLI